MGYLETMDGMVQFIVDSADNVDKTQILILAMEGVALASLAVLYVWYLSSQVKHPCFVRSPDGVAITSITWLSTDVGMPSITWLSTDVGITCITCLAVSVM